MIKHYHFSLILWLSLLISPILTLGQNAYDTLSFFKSDLSTEEAELEFINAINDHSNSAHEKARGLSFMYFQYAKDKNDSVLIKSAYYQLAVIYLQDTKYDSSLHCLQVAKTLATKQNDTKALINIERTIGAVYLSTKQNNEALNSFNTSLELAKASSDSVGMAKALNNLSILSSSANEYENALGYLKRSLDLKIAYAPKQEQISTLINIGNNYSNLHNYSKALDYLNRARKMAIEFHEQKKLAEIWTHIAQINIIIGEYEEAHQAFISSIDISQNINDEAHLRMTIKKYAEFLMIQEKWEEAEVKLEAILSDLTEKQNPEFLMEIYYDLGKIAYETKNHLKSQAWLSQAVSISNIPHGEILEKSYNLLSLISYINGEYELAYHHLRISEFMSDSIEKNVNTDRLRELQVKYNSVNDKESIENLLEISELKENERQKSKFYFLITFSLFVITLAIAIALARQARIKHKQSTELTSQIEENLKKTKDLLKANKLAEEGLKVKSEFIAMVSHEIRTPMNAIIGMSSLLSDTDLNDYQKNYLNNISISSNNLLILLNDILDFSRVEAGKVSIKLHPADLSKELKHVVNMFPTFSPRKRT